MKCLYLLLLGCSLSINFLNAQNPDYRSKVSEIWDAIENNEAYLPLFTDLARDKAAWKDKNVINLNFELMLRGEDAAFVYFRAHKNTILQTWSNDEYEQLEQLIEWSFEILEAECVRQNIDPEDTPPANLEKIATAIFQKIFEDPLATEFFTTVMLLNISEEAFWIEGMQYFMNKLYQINWNIAIPQKALEELYNYAITISWALYEEIEMETASSIYLHKALNLAHHLEVVNPTKDIYITIAQLYEELGNQEDADFYYSKAKKQ